MTEVDIVLPRKHFELRIQESFSEGITGIFGPSGAGKTSLLQAISGLAVPKTGRISISGRVLFDSSKGIHLPVHKRNIGYVFQEGRLFPHMSVEKNLRYGIKKGQSPQISFDEVVELLHLQALLNSKPSNISGGERQRTALGRSLLASPDILLLDEPFSAVDIGLRKQILPFILRIQQHIGIPILVVSHDLPDLLKLTQTLLIMKEGKSIGHGSYQDLLKQEDISRLFGSSPLVNSIDGSIQQISSDHRSTIFEWTDGKRQVWIKCKTKHDQFQEGQSIRIFVHADDIALSKEALTHVSIQNQLKGLVQDIIRREGKLLCIVDVGFSLLVEITTESQQRMDIQKGSEVWCLFKSVAIDVAG